MTTSNPLAFYYASVAFSCLQPLRPRVHAWVQGGLGRFTTLSEVGELRISFGHPVALQLFFHSHLHGATNTVLLRSCLSLLWEVTTLRSQNATSTMLTMDKPVKRPKVPPTADNLSLNVAFASLMTRCMKAFPKFTCKTVTFFRRF